MKIKLVVLITLVAFVNLMFGCATGSRVTTEEKKSPSQSSTASITLIRVIEGVVLRSGRVISFNDERGIFDRDDITIRGTTPEGEVIVCTYLDMESVRVLDGTDDLEQVHEIDRASFFSQARLKPWQTAQVCEGIRPSAATDNGRYRPLQAGSGNR